ncbi:MAG: bis(5'-nucleosyl)-tetraphosphatase (symmetrical) YqeK [Coriobacteriia bacterium]|nr:bis(5'-nucleosyl)-tetraphosphatase (symmetrical) YqeK [Coriobacteriia bacterium]
MSGVSFERAHEALSRRVGPDAVEHCERVSVTAVELAEVYEVDTASARIAGLLHDWSRDDSGDALLRAAARAGIDITEVDRDRPYLLHAATAAAELRAVLPELSPEIVSAVERHTMGATQMSDLDRIIYIADMIEPTRAYSAADELRRLVGDVSLEELFVEAYAISVTHLVDKRRKIHPRTLEVWNHLVDEMGAYRVPRAAASVSEEPA